MGIMERISNIDIPEEKKKWMKGILSGFFIIIVTNFTTPLQALILILPISTIWQAYLSLLWSTSVIVIVAFIVFLLGKPLIGVDYIPEVAENDEDEVAMDTNLNTKNNPNSIQS